MERRVGSPRTIQAAASAANAERRILLVARADTPYRASAWGYRDEPATRTERDCTHSMDPECKNSQSRRTARGSASKCVPQEAHKEPAGQVMLPPSPAGSPGPASERGRCAHMVRDDPQPGVCARSRATYLITSCRPAARAIKAELKSTFRAHAQPQPAPVSPS